MLFLYDDVHDLVAAVLAGVVLVDGAVYRGGAGRAVILDDLLGESDFEDGVVDLEGAVVEVAFADGAADFAEFLAARCVHGIEFFSLDEWLLEFREELGKSAGCVDVADAHEAADEQDDHEYCEEAAEDHGVQDVRFDQVERAELAVRIEEDLGQVLFVVVFGEHVDGHRGRDHRDRGGHDDQKDGHHTLQGKCFSLIIGRTVDALLDFVGDAVEAVACENFGEDVGAAAVRALAGEVEFFLDAGAAVLAFAEGLLAEELDLLDAVDGLDLEFFHVEDAEEPEFEADAEFGAAGDFGEVFDRDLAAEVAFKIAGVESCVADEFSGQIDEQQDDDADDGAADRAGHGFCGQSCVDVVSVVDQKVEGDVGQRDDLENA